MEESVRRILASARSVHQETWQMGVGRLPFWIHPPEGGPFRPLFATCHCPGRRDAASVESFDIADDPRPVLARALGQAARDWRSWPERVQVDDPDLAPLLEDLLAGHEIPVEVCGELPGLRDAQARAPVAQPSQEDADQPAVPGVLTGEGVTLAHVESFARAAVDFHAAAPWRLFGREDLLRIETAEIDPALRHAVVVGSTEGATVLFYRDPAVRDAILRSENDAGEVDAGSRTWVLSLCPPWELPLEDADLWQRQGLPQAGEDQFCAMAVGRRGASFTRPDARRLAFFEGVLKALAATSESEADRGSWAKDVLTALGPLHLALSLPDLLALSPGADPPVLPELLERVAEQKRSVLSQWLGEPPEDEAGDGEDEDPFGELLRAAPLLGGRRAALLARRALALRPDSSAVYLQLAATAPGSSQAIDLYRRAQELADCAMPSPPPQPEWGDLCAEHETAWHHALRARGGLAEALYGLGQLEKAAEILTEAAQLDPHGLTVVHDPLACLLVELGRDSEAETVIAEGKTSAAGSYTRALLAFRRGGDTDASRRVLRQAFRANPLIPDALLPNAELDLDDLPVYEGDDVDAAAYAEFGGNAWRRTPGALTWLADCVDTAAVEPERRKRDKKKGKKKRLPRHRPQRAKKKQRRR